MNVLIDTNVILDVLLRREPFFEKSQLVILAAEENFFNGFVSASAITDIFYVIAKLLKNKSIARELIKRHLVDTLNIAAVDDGIIKNALDAKWNDFEDSI